MSRNGQLVVSTVVAGNVANPRAQGAASNSTNRSQADQPMRMSRPTGGGSSTQNEVRDALYSPSANKCGTIQIHWLNYYLSLHGNEDGITRAEFERHPPHLSNWRDSDEAFYRVVFKCP